MPSSIDGQTSMSPVHAGTSARSSSAANRDRSAEREREDKLLNAKRKLKSYRARQSKANNAPGSPSSPSKTLSTASSSSSIASKRSSYIQPRSSQVSTVSTHGREKSVTLAGGGGKIAHGHAHRRSHSRNLSISNPVAASNINGPLSASLAANGHSPREAAKEREARRASLIFGKVDPAAVAAACVAAAAASSTNNAGNTSPAMSSSASTPTQANTPTQATSSQTPSSSSTINEYHANRRSSRRHSRTSSISISIAPSNFDGFAAVSPSGASPRKLSYPSLPPPSASSSSSLLNGARSPKGSNNGSFPSSASSPALASSLASFTLGGASNRAAGNRQSVPAFATAAQTTLQNGRIVLSTHQQGISPQSSPQPPQHAFAGSFSASNNTMLNPTSALKSYRRASLGVPKSPSFFESQQLAVSLSEQGSNNVSPSSAGSTSSNTTAAPSTTQHARKNSRHSRRISVSTRRESMEIMAGLIPSLLPTSPNPSNFKSSEMDRLNNSTNSNSSSGNGYEDTVLGSSLAMEERQLSEEEERDFALSRLEGRLSVRYDPIQLPDESTTSISSAINDLTENTASQAGSQAKLLSSTINEKRNSWNPRDSWGSTSPFAVNYGGANKTGNLDMLVEEEEEEEEEAEQTETEAERQAETSHDVSMTQEEQEVVSEVQDVVQNQKRQRPGSLALPPKRNNSTTEERAISPPVSAASSSHSSVKIGGQRLPPRPLSLISSSSMGNLSSLSSTSSPANSDVKAARRQSGLRSLTLTSPEHALNAPSSSTSTASPALGSATRRRQSLLLNNAVSPSTSNYATSPSPSSNNGGIRPFSISSTSSILSPDSSFRSNFQFGSSTKESQLQSSNLHNGLPARTRNSVSNASNASIASSALSTPSRIAGSSAPPSTTAATHAASGSARPRFGARRFSDLTSPVSAGFGDLVMEESLAEEDEDELEDEESESAVEHEKILDGLHDRNDEDDESMTQKMDFLAAEAGDISRADSSITNISVSDDPVILDLQVRALKSQVEHLRTQVATSNTAHKEEVESLRFELAEARETILNAEEEREMLREDIDGWRTRCADLERALQSERSKLDDERREGMLLREKVRKLGDRLTSGQTTLSSPDEGSSSSDGTIDASLVNAQAKLIGEMRDQIFSLAAALERERLRNTGDMENDGSRSSSPLLRALASQDAKIAATLREDEAAEAEEKANRVPHHNTSTQSSAASGSYNFSSSFSSIHSQMGNNTEDTSVGDDNDSMCGSKSPSSPAFWASSPTPSFSQLSSSGNNGISIHSSNMPLRNSDLCMNFGGLQTLAEEDEEDTQDDDLDGEIDEVNAQAKKALSLSGSSEEGENDRVPELIHDEALSQRRADFEALRARTQSTSTGSSMDTNDHMPLTPAKEHSSPNLPAQAVPQHQQQSKPSHNRSDSFIKQWSFPKGPVEPLDLSEHHHNDSFWALYQGILPALPLTSTAIDPPPFSAEITLDEEYFHIATSKPLPASRPSSTYSIPSRPPISRATSQATRLREEVDSNGALLHASPSSISGSRLSLQGFSSLWGNYMRSPQTPPVADHTGTPSSPSKPTSVQQKSVPHTMPASGRKPLLRLQPSPIGNLNFAHAASCCGDVNGHSHRILRL